MSEKNNGEYLTANDLVTWLGISKQNIYLKCYRKEIPYYKLGKVIRFKKDEIEKWMKQKQVKEV